MRLWFKCEKEGTYIELAATPFRPNVGDFVSMSGKEYEVEKVVWCLEHPPAQSGILCYIKPVCQ